MPPKVKGFHIGWKIDQLAERFGFRFVCFSPYKGELDYLNNEKAVLHLPDVAGYLRCIYCGRFKRFHRTGKITKSMV